MFAFIAGISADEYIRRRLTPAAQELLDPDVQVIDVALKYGYSEWLPASWYEKADASEFEMYGRAEERVY